MILLKTPSDIIDNSVIYLKICVGLSFGQLIYNGAASILRALGDSKTPLYFLILTTILNIILDLLFVALLKMNVAGVAIATVVSQMISAFLSVFYIIKKFPILKLNKEDMIFDSSNLLMIVKIGASMSIQSVFLSIGEMIISGVVNTFGTNVVASYTTGNRIIQFASMAYFVVSEAFAVYVAQNYGAQIYFLILTTILNIILDLLFVALLKMNVAGVAIATVVSQMISAFLSVFYIIKKFPILKLNKEDMIFDSSNLLMIVKIGASMSIQSVFLSIGEMIISGVVNTFGTNVVASYTTGNRIIQFASMAYFVVSEAFAVYVAQNYGAQKIDRIKEGFKSIIILSLTLSILAAVIIFLFGDHLVKLFISKNDQYVDVIAEICKGYLRISSAFFPFLAIILLYNNSIRAIGNAFIPLISGITEIVIKIGGSLLLSIPFGYIGVWFANPVGWALGILPTCIYFHKYAFKLKK